MKDRLDEQTLDIWQLDLDKYTEIRRLKDRLENLEKQYGLKKKNCERRQMKIWKLLFLNGHKLYIEDLRILYKGVRKI